MKIGILGSGVMGSALATRFARAGHDVRAGASDPGRFTNAGPYRISSRSDAVAHADLVFLAIPWPHGLDVVRGIGTFGNRVLVDVSNPESPDGRGLAVGLVTSGAEEISRAAKDARVVKAFSHVYAELLTEDVSFEGPAPSVLYCGDDPGAKEVVRAAIESCGFDPVDSGPLASARFLEPFAMLTVQLVREQGWGPAGIAWRLMRRPGVAADAR